MAKPWKDVESSKAYLSLSRDEQEDAKTEYFNTVVAVKPQFKKLDAEQQDTARAEFFGFAQSPDNVEKNNADDGNLMGVAMSGFNARGNAGLSDLSGIANGATIGLARPVIKAVSGQDIGEGSILGRMAGTALPSSMVGRGVGLMAKGASPLVRGALQLGGEGAVTALGSSPEDSFKKYIQNAPIDIVGGGASNMVIGGALNLAGKAINVIPENAKKLAYREINSLIKPSKGMFSYSKNPGRGVAEEGIVASSLEELLDKTESSMKNIWSEVSSNVNNSKASVDLTDVGKIFDNAITEAKKTPKINKALIKRLNDTRKDIINLKHLKGMSATDVLDFKQTIGNLTKFTGNPSDDKLVNETLKKVFGIAKERLEGAVPGMSKLTERYADLISAKVATRNVMNGSQSKAIIGWIPRMALTAGGAIAGTMGGGAMGGLAGTAAALALEKFAGSPQAKTAFAKFLAKNVSKMPKVNPNVIKQGGRLITSGLSSVMNPE